MTPKPQKGKHRKRRRGWHHGPLEDQRFERAISQLDAAADESGVHEWTPDTKETHTEREGSHE
jgi:hypothetical protein